MVTAKTVFRGWPIKAFAALGLSTILMVGCAASSASEKSNRASSEQVDNKTSDSFTTKNRPTKTIETPWGPKEIYDPISDEAVLTAFKRLYEDGTKLVRRDTLGSKSSDESTVFYARVEHYKSIVAQGCDVLSTADCGTGYNFMQKTQTNWANSFNYEQCLNSGQEKENCRWKNILISRPTPSSHCRLDGSKTKRTHESTWWYPVSQTVQRRSVKTIPKKTRSLNESIDWFFKSNCRKWAVNN